MPRFPSYVGIRSGVATPSATTPSAPPKPANLAPAKKASSSGKRYFEFVEGTSSKFWEIEIAGADVTVRYGRIGADGQMKSKSFADEAAAQKHGDGLIAEKTEKGYVEK